MAGQKKKTNTNGANNKNTRIRDMTGFLPPGVPASCGVFETPRSGAQLLIAFLNLPVELRNKIYEHALLSDLDKDFIAKPNNGAGCHVRCEVEGPKSKGTGLFRVSRQISFESTTYFYSQLKFEIEDRPYCKNQSTYRLNADNNAYQPSSLMDFKPFLLAIGEQNCASIRHLKINLTRLRTVEDRTRRYSGFGTRFLTDPLELLARSNCLRTLEINIDLQGGLDTFTSNDRIIKELHKFSGIQTVKITGQDSTRFREGAKKRATKLEKEISNIPSSKSSKATMQLFGPQKADISPAVRNAKKYGLVLARKLEARQELVEQQEAVDDLHKVFEEKCKNVGMALEQMKEDITQYDLDLEEATKEVLANAQRAREAHAVEYALYN
ncbi:hypothetical protein MMC10_005973 [Thelotrema lepadinum]|nr:hypothetical protein [Thelotrema lepadinum]